MFEELLCWISDWNIFQAEQNWQKSSSRLQPRDAGLGLQDDECYCQRSLWRRKWRGKFGLPSQGLHTKAKSTGSREDSSQCQSPPSGISWWVFSSGNVLKWRPTWGNVFVSDSRDHSPTSPPQKDQTFHKSEIFLERPPPPSLGRLVDRQVRCEERGGVHLSISVQYIHSEWREASTHQSQHLHHQVGPTPPPLLSSYKLIIFQQRPVPRWSRQAC